MTEAEARRTVRKLGGGICELPSGELVFTHFRKTGVKEGAAVWVGSFFPAGKSWVQPLGTIGCYGAATAVKHVPCETLAEAVALAIRAMHDKAGPAPPIRPNKLVHPPEKIKGGKPRGGGPMPTRKIRKRGGFG